MTAPTDKDKQKIIRALSERGAHGPCPRCGNPTFTLLDGYFNQTIQNELGTFVVGGPSVPSVVLACNRCGFLAQHALGALGMLPKPEQEKEVKK